jgi:hypothetical protein
MQKKWRLLKEALLAVAATFRGDGLFTLSIFFAFLFRRAFFRRFSHSASMASFISAICLGFKELAICLGFKELDGLFLHPKGGRVYNSFVVWFLSFAFVHVTFNSCRSIF